jgi:hypothetical protein
MITKTKVETKVDHAQVVKEAVRLAHQFRHLIQFAEVVGDVAAWEASSAEIKQHLDQLKTEEAEVRERVTAAEKQAVELVAAAKRKVTELIADAERRAGEITARAEATAAKLAADTTELTRVGATLQAMKAEVENLRSRFN